MTEIFDDETSNGRAPPRGRLALMLAALGLLAAFGLFTSRPTIATFIAGLEVDPAAAEDERPPARNPALRKANPSGVSDCSLTATVLANDTDWSLIEPRPKICATLHDGKTVSECEVLSEDGKASLSLGCSRRTKVHVLALSSTFTMLHPPKSLWLGPADSKSITLALQRANGVVSGRVLDRLGGPVERAVVAGVCSGQEATPPSFAVADEAGNFTLARPLDCALEGIKAHAEGYAEGFRALNTGEDAVEIKLFPAQEVAGRVVNSAGEPVAGALVAARRLSDLSGEPQASTVSQPDGRFRFQLGVGSWNLVAATENLRGATPDAVEVTLAEPTKGIEIVAHEAPVVVVHVSEALAEACSGTIAVMLHGRGMPKLDEVAITQPGDIQFSAVPPGGGLKGRLECNGYRAVVEPITSDRWEPALALGEEIRGTVVDEAGLPVPAASVSFSSPSNKKSGSSKTGPNGHFSLGGLQVLGELGTLSVRWARGLEPIEVEVAVGEVEVSVDVPSALSVTGRVVDRSGHGVFGRKVTIEAPASETCTSVSGGSGEFACSVPGVSAGDMVTLSAFDLEDKLSTSLETGESPPFEIVVDGWSLEGRVVTTDAVAHVLAYDAAEKFIAGTEAAADGSFSLHGLPQGEALRVRAKTPDGSAVDVEQVVEGDVLEIEMPDPGAATLELTGSAARSGLGLGLARAKRSGAFFPSLIWELDVQGTTMSLNSIGPGDYQVGVSFAGAECEGDVSVVSGETTSGELSCE